MDTMTDDMNMNMVIWWYEYGDMRTRFHRQYKINDYDIRKILNILINNFGKAIFLVHAN